MFWVALYNVYFYNSSLQTVDGVTFFKSLLLLQFFSDYHQTWHT